MHICVTPTWMYILVSRGMQETIYIVSVLQKEEGYTVKYILSPRDFQRAQAIFHSISRLESQYGLSHLANNGPALAEAYAEVTAVSGILDIAVAIELIASVETVLAAMMTCSRSNIRSHSY